MKKYGTLIALAVAVICGIVAVILANKLFSGKVSDETVIIKEQVPLEHVVIAAKDLEIGSLLTKENMTLAEWPKANMPKGAFTKIEEIDGRVIVTKKVAGTPIVSTELAAAGSGVGLVAKIDPGKRAMAIRVDEVIGVGGFILPNTFVDIIAVDTRGKVRTAKTILERIEVLAIAQETFVEEGEPKLVRTVTMELTPKEAEKLSAQINQSPIHLVLRNPAEDVEEPPKPVAKKKVVRKYRPKPKPAPEFNVELIQGDTAPVQYRFKSTEQQ